MQKGQFTDEQIVAILQQAEKGEKPITELCRQHNIAETTFYRWRSTFGGMNVSEAARVRELEKENARLKRLLAERDLEVDVMAGRGRGRLAFEPSGDRAFAGAVCKAGCAPVSSQRQWTRVHRPGGQSVAGKQRGIAPLH